MRLCMNKKMNTKGEDMHYISVVSIKIDGHCVITKISIHHPPPPPTETESNGNSEGRWLLEVLFPGTLIKIGEVLKINSCSVEQNYQLFHC